MKDKDTVTEIDFYLTDEEAVAYRDGSVPTLIIIRGHKRWRTLALLAARPCWAWNRYFYCADCEVAQIVAMAEGETLILQWISGYWMAPSLSQDEYNIKAIKVHNTIRCDLWIAEEKAREKEKAVRKWVREHPTEARQMLEGEMSTGPQVPVNTPRGGRKRPVKEFTFHTTMEEGAAHENGTTKELTIIRGRNRWRTLALLAARPCMAETYPFYCADGEADKIAAMVKGASLTLQRIATLWTTPGLAQDEHNIDKLRMKYRKQNIALDNPYTMLDYLAQGFPRYYDTLDIGGADLVAIKAEEEP